MNKEQEWKAVPAIKGIQKCHVCKLEVMEKDIKNSYMAQTAQHEFTKIKLIKSVNDCIDYLLDY